jgi:hypothetical protein
MCWKMLRTNLSNGTKRMNNPFFHGEVFVFPLNFIPETLMYTLSQEIGSNDFIQGTICFTIVTNGKAVITNTCLRLPNL